jgi:hypothetical protein
MNTALKDKNKSDEKAAGVSGPWLARYVRNRKVVALKLGGGYIDYPFIINKLCVILA